MRYFSLMVVFGLLLMSTQRLGVVPHSETLLTNVVGLALPLGYDVAPLGSACLGDFFF